MAEVKFARIELKTQDLTFMAEGEPEWLAKQLDKVLEALRVAQQPGKLKQQG